MIKYFFTQRELYRHYISKYNKLVRLTGCVSILTKQKIAVIKQSTRKELIIEIRRIEELLRDYTDQENKPKIIEIVLVLASIATIIALFCFAVFDLPF